jgi:hypothetical protein
MRGLPVTELSCRLRLDDVVDPGRAATEVLLGGLDDLEAGDAGERRARRERKPLGVAEVARVLERHAHGQWVPRRTRSDICEQLADVADFAETAAPSSRATRRALSDESRNRRS